MNILSKFSVFVLLISLIAVNQAIAQANTATPGPEFSALLERIEEVATSEQQALADSFLTAQSNFPKIESDTVALFMYKGNVSSVHIPGDANGWDSDAYPMQKIANTNVWYRLLSFESDARLDYKFVLSGSNWILDPRNSQRVSGGFGPNSEVRMPEYIFPDEIVARDNVPKGVIDSFSFSSSVLNNSRTIRVYVPPNYNSDNSYPMMLFHDGSEFISLANAQNVFDNLIHDRKINPTIGVFVPPVDRSNEYAWEDTDKFENFIVTELMPFLEDNYAISSDAAERGMIGPSYAALITAQIVYNNPEVFGNAALLSTAFWANNQSVYNQIINGPKVELTWYIDWGTYEGSGITDYSPPFTAMLAEKEYPFKSNIWHDGHSWGNWRAHIDEALEFFFPFSDSTNTALPITESPHMIELSQNYPNPFNPTTTISFTLSEADEIELRVFNVLGKEVSVVASGRFAEGTHNITFDGMGLSSGVYYYILSTSQGNSARKMLLLK
ncbi:MAG: alpha/beta hydrolase-fold protein [bacterium]|nr:alpha/beta hydrolase-fold protein [bacterium]